MKKYLLIMLSFLAFIYLAGCCDCNKGARPSDPQINEKLNALKFDIESFYNNEMTGDLDQKSVNQLINKVDKTYDYIVNVEGTGGLTAKQMDVFRNKLNEDVANRKKTETWTTALKEEKKSKIINELDRVIMTQLSPARVYGCSIVIDLLK